MFPHLILDRPPYGIWKQAGFYMVSPCGPAPYYIWEHIGIKWRQPHMRYGNIHQVGSWGSYGFIRVHMWIVCDLTYMTYGIIQVPHMFTRGSYRTCLHMIHKNIRLFVRNHHIVIWGSRGTCRPIWYRKRTTFIRNPHRFTYGHMGHVLHDVWDQADTGASYVHKRLMKMDKCWGCCSFLLYGVNMQPRFREEDLYASWQQLLSLASAYITHPDSQGAALQAGTKG